MKIAFPDDFSDRLSPMLVKELRQGLRTRFIGVFLTLQIILGIILLGAGTTATSDHAGNTISTIIFVFFSIAVIIIQPMRGMGALSSEIKGNTIDMMVLTRLSAWRIVTGKWSAIVSQSALMMVTIIPYLILRYFFGGMNLVGEIVLILLIFITSATLTAITVGLSASTSVILRSIIPIIGVIFGRYSLFALLIFSRLGGGGGSFLDYFSMETQESRIGIGLFVTSCLYYGFFLLSIGTTLIAPLADNYSTLRRLVALFVTTVATALCVMYVDDIEVLMVIFSLIFTPIFTISLTEFNMLVPPVVNRFRRYGFLGRIFGAFFLPGWASGVFFCYLLLVIASISFNFVTIPSYNEELITLTIAMVGSLIFPGLLVYFFKMQGPARVSNYILLSAAIGIVSLTLVAISESLSNGGFLWLFIWLPPVSMIMIENHRIDEDAVLISTALINIVYLVAFLVLAIRQYRDSMQNLNESKSAD